MKNIFIVMLFLIFSVNVFASEYNHHKHPPHFHDNSAIEESIEREVNRGTSLASAMGGHQYYKVNNKWKYSAVIVFGDSDSAASIGIGKADGDTLFTGTFGTNGHESKAMIGAHGSF